MSHQSKTNRIKKSFTHFIREFEFSDSHMIQVVL